MTGEPSMKHSQFEPLAYARRHRFGTATDLPKYMTACALVGIALFAIAALRADTLLTTRNALPDPVSYAYATLAWFGAAGIVAIVTLVLWIATALSRAQQSRHGLVVSGVASVTMVVAALVAGWYVGLVLLG